MEGRGVFSALLGKGGKYSMMDEMRGNVKLVNEYEETFDSEEKISNSIKITKDSFSIDVGVVEFEDLLFPDSVKKGRKETYLGLTTSVAELGIVVPIHVMVTEGFATWVAENPGVNQSEYEGYKYILLQGFRRVWAGYKNKLTRCNAVIWDFKDKEKGSELATTLSLILDKTQRRSWNEIWYLYQILEVQSNLTPGTIEYLLQLDYGDAGKLKEIMTRGYQEVVDELTSNKKSLDQCYRMLQKLMNEEDRLMKEDSQGISEVDEAKEIVEDADKDNVLSSEDVNEILEMGDSFDGELSDDEFDELMGNNIEYEGQKVGERHPLDPALRAAVLQRDGYHCQITGRGEGLPANIALSILNVHHLIPVSNGGKDCLENLITVCLDAHTLIHIIQRNNGKLGMSREQYESLPEEEQKFIKGVMKIARIAVESDRRLGKTREEIRKETSDSVKFKMPGLVQKENMEAIIQADKMKKEAI